MYSRANYTVVGVFVLLFGAGLIWFALWLGKYGTYREFDLYKIEMRESVSGLSKDSVVKFHGVDIGRVKEIRINPDDIEKIEIFVEIKKGIPIKEDMVASLQLLGVTGLMSISIEGGSNEAKTLVPTKDHIPVIPTAPSWMSKAKQNIGNLSEQIVKLLNQGEKLLTDKNIKNLEKILVHMENITSRGGEFMAKSIDTISEINATATTFNSSAVRLTDRLVSLSDDITEALDQTNSSLAKIQNSTDPVLKKLMTTVKNFNRVTLRVEKTLKRGDYNLKKIFEPMLVDIELMSNQISEIMKEIDRSPSDMIFKSRKRRKAPGE